MPIAISVNMFRFRVRTEFQPRTKNGHPAHSTTGVASTSWIHPEACGDTRSATPPTRSRPISSSTTGTVNATPTQNRRLMSASSAFGPESAVTTTGSNAIPQIGHDPGPGRRICGCIGQVHSTASSPPASPGSPVPAPAVVPGPGSW